MTRIVQKQAEFHFAKEAARLMDVQWKLVAHEESNGGPDFIVHEGADRFGLEVHEIFNGEITPKKGSRLKQRQAGTQKLIDRIRQRYEDIEKDVGLYVKFLGDLNDDGVEPIIQALLDMNLQKNFSHSKECVLKHNSGRLKIFDTRLPDGWPRNQLSRRDWFSVTDSGGWREQESRKILEAVEMKSGKKADGHLHGFNAVYFFPSPKRPVLLKQGKRGVPEPQTEPKRT